MKAVQLIIVFTLITFFSIAQNKAMLFDSLFTAMHARGQFNGSVLIAEKGKVVFEDTYGFANREQKRDINKSTSFNTGSVAKIFTAVAIQQLAEKRELKVETPIIRYLPDFPYPQITVHHLLIHAGGLSECEPLLRKAQWNPSRIATNEDLLSALYDQKPELKFTPGEKSQYSNLGYILLAEVVEKVSGTDFAGYLEKHIFQPAGMKHTRIYDGNEVDSIANIANGYVFYPFTGKYERAVSLPEFSFSNVVSGFEGDGNVYSTASDLFRFCQALEDGVLLSENSFETALEKHILARNMKGNNEYGNSFGYGWTVLDAPEKVINRGGELPGYLANIIWNVTEDQIFIYLMNEYLAYTSYNREIFPAYMKILLSNKLEVPRLFASVELTEMAVTSSIREMKDKIEEIRNHPDLYTIDVPGLKFLVHKLKQLGKHEKANLVMESFKTH